MIADRELVDALARTLYAAYAKEMTGVPGKWADLDSHGRGMWLRMAMRGIRRIDELRLSEATA